MSVRSIFGHFCFLRIVVWTKALSENSFLREMRHLDAETSAMLQRQELNGKNP